MSRGVVGLLARGMAYCGLALVLLAVAYFHEVWVVDCSDMGHVGSSNSYCVRQHPHAYVLAPAAIAVVVVLLIVFTECGLAARRRRNA
jgi:hypothetical protein